jgi:uncharacterized membrane protein (UPF0127 family)
MGWKDFFRPKIVRVKIGKRKLRIKDCRNFFSLTGLMFDNMEKIDGALIYGNSLWMPFVKKDLELIFLDDDFKVVGVQDAVPLTLDPRTWRIYENRRARYCLEISRGLAPKRLKDIRLY